MYVVGVNHTEYKSTDTVAAWLHGIYFGPALEPSDLDVSAGQACPRMPKLAREVSFTGFRLDQITTARAQAT